MWVRRPAAAHCGAVGAAMAHLHLAGDGFPLTRRNALSVSGWRPLYDLCRSRADMVQPGLSAEIEDELDFLEAGWPRSLPQGVIHADLFRDNVFFLGDRLSGIIDFYFACNDALAYDIAIGINAWCFEADVSLNITKARAFLGGYQSVRRLSSAEFAALPVLCRGSALRFLLTRLYDWLEVPPGALVVPKDPIEYYRKLRFHRSVNDATAYGFAA
jgi:homoserine kinase type II